VVVSVGGRCSFRTCHPDAHCIQTTSRSHRCSCRDGFYGNGKICIGKARFPLTTHFLRHQPLSSLSLA